MMTAELPRHAQTQTVEFSSLLEAAIMETESRRPVAVATVKPISRPVAAPVADARPAKASNGTPRRQKLATHQVAAGRYAFNHAGCDCEVTSGADGWKITINGVTGNRRYETKRHAVNSARLFLDSRAATVGTADTRPAMKPAPVAVAAPVVTITPPAPAAPATGWRSKGMTDKQAAMLIRLRSKLTAADLIPSSPLADKKGLTRGEASELIDSMKTQLDEPINSMNRRRYRRSAAGPQVDTCNIGPFNRGYCLCCSKRQA